MFLEKKPKKSRSWIHKYAPTGLVEKLVHTEDLHLYLDEGWFRGRAACNTKFGRPEDPNVYIKGNQKGKIWIWCEGKSKMIPKEDFPKFAAKGWVLGRKGDKDGKDNKDKP